MNNITYLKSSREIIKILYIILQKKNICFSEILQILLKHKTLFSILYKNKNISLFKQEKKNYKFSIYNLYIIIYSLIRNNSLNSINLITNFLRFNTNSIQITLYNLNLNTNYTTTILNILNKVEYFTIYPYKKNTSISKWDIQILTQLKNIFFKKYINNIILHSEEDTLSFEIINKFISFYKLNKYILLKLDDISLLSDLNLIKIKETLNLLFSTNITNIILICPNIDILFYNTLENNKNNINNLFIIDILKPYLLSHKLKIIGTIKPINYLTLNKIIPNLNLFFKIIFIKEPSDNELLYNLTNKLYLFENYYKIIIHKNILKPIISLSKIYNLNIKNPLKAYYILDEICSLFSLNYNKNLILNKYYFSKITKSLSLLPSTYKYNPQKLLNMFKIILYKNIKGQPEAIKKILTSIQLNLTGLSSSTKPIGSWILAGPSGTGKTELVKTISKAFFNSSANLIRFDMSEFKEKHTISRLIGSPPGYIGYGEGGELTNKVKNKGNCVILFDEIEKAHPDIFDIMLQILDEGHLTDSLGEKINFTKTIIIFTSNLGCSKQTIKLNINNLNKLILKSINNYFKPEFINRLTDIITFKPLTKKDLILIFDKFILNLLQKLPNINIYIENNIKLYLINLSYKPFYGARPLKRIIENTIEKIISNLLSKYKIIQNFNNYFLKFYLDPFKNCIKFYLIKI